MHGHERSHADVLVDYARRLVCCFSQQWREPAMRVMVSTVQGRGSFFLLGVCLTFLGPRGIGIAVWSFLGMGKDCEGPPKFQLAFSLLHQ